MLVVVGFDRREEGLRIERLVPKVREPAAVDDVRSRFDDVVGCALAAEHHGGAARLDLELIDRFNRHPERQIPAFALHDRIGDGDPFHVHVSREVLTAHDVAPASDRLHTRHEKHERRRIAGSTGVHDERERGVNLVSNRLTEPRVGGGERRRRGRDDDLLCDAAHLQRHIQSNHAQRIDDDSVADEGPKAVERNGHAILTGSKRHQCVDASLRRRPDSGDTGRDVGRRHGRAWNRRVGRVDHGSLNRTASADLGARDRWCEQQERRREQPDHRRHNRLPVSFIATLR